jgi:hypothetical protein
VQNTTAASAATVGMGDAIVSVGVTEDLGGGMRIAANTTLQTKAGRAGTVTNNGYGFAITGGFGSVSLTSGLAGAATLSAGISAANDMNTAVGTYKVRNRLQYTLPTFVDGLSVHLQKDQDGASATDFQGAVTPTTPFKIAVGYKTGDLTVGLTGLTTSAMNLTDSTVTVGYNAGFANLGVAYRNKASENGHYEITAVAPLGDGVTAGFHMIAGGATEATGFRVTYALSKRSAVSFNYVDVKAGATTGTNYRVRVSHSF